MRGDFREHNDVMALEDVMREIQKVPMIDDEITRENIIEFRIKCARKRIQLVNSNFEAFKGAWANGTPKDFYFALENANDNVEEVLQLVTDIEYRNQIKRKHIENKEPPVKRVEILSEDESDLSDDSDGDAVITSRRKRNAHWTADEIEDFKNYVNSSNKNAIKNWDFLARRFPKRTGEQCKNMYNRLRAKGEIIQMLHIKNDKQNKKNETKGKQDKTPSIPDELQHITSLIFKNKDSTLYTGAQAHFLHKYATVNPLAGSIDTVTLSPIYVAAMSKDYYVLNYFTWLKIIKTNKVNPYTGNPIVSKRNLKILTVYNFHKYKDKIRNLTEIQAPGNENTE